MAGAARKPAARAPDVRLLGNIVQRQNSIFNDVQVYDGPLLPEDEDEALAGTLWAVLSEHDMIKPLTNVTAEQVRSIYHSMMPHIAAALLPLHVGSRGSLTARLRST